MADAVLEITDDNFESEVIQSSLPVLVDFWAPWCGPCRAIAPMIHELATEYQGKVKVGKLNIDDSPNASQQFEVMNIPTLMIFKDGQVVQRFLGGQPKAKLKAALDAAQG